MISFLSFLFLAQATVSFLETKQDLQGYAMSTNVNHDGIMDIMDILKANLSAAMDQTMVKLDSILLLNGNNQVSDGLRQKIILFKDDLTVCLEKDLKSLVGEFKRALDGPLSEDEQYEFSESVKAKWEDSLALKLEAFSKDVLPAWTRSVVHVWKGVENVVVRNIKKFKEFVHKSYLKSQDTCSLPKSVFIGSNHINTALSRLGMIKRSIFEIFEFIGAIIGGILLVIGSEIILGLYFVAYLIGTIIAALARVLGASDTDYLF